MAGLHPGVPLRRGAGVIRATLDVWQHVNGGGIHRPGYVVEGADLAALLTDAVQHLLDSSFRPIEGETLFLSLPEHPVHVAAGFIVTHRVSRRTVRRAKERLWPEGEPSPEVAKKAAWLLLDAGETHIRVSPFMGLVATRT